MEKHTTELKKIILKYDGTLDGAKWILQKFNYKTVQIGSGQIIGRTEKHEVIVGENTITYRRLDDQPFEENIDLNYLKRLAKAMHTPEECSILTKGVKVNEHRRTWE